MRFDFQTAATLLFIVWAVLYIAWRAWRTLFRKRAGGCGGCAKCPVKANTPTNLVSVESLLGASKRQS